VNNSEDTKHESGAHQPQSQQKSPLWASLAVLLVWCAAALLVSWSIWSIQPPTALPASAPQQEFSAERAMAHVRAISTVPHPIGSPALESVRHYLIDQLTSLGLNPQLYSSVGFRAGRTNLFAGNVQDIVARLKGSANSRAVLLMAHYDSVKNAPGAADDGAGIASILETLRALRSGRPLKDDVIVLFTDGEEGGMLGAEAFVAGHPWLKDVGLVLNFDARGDRGPSLLFETSNGNGKLIEEAQRANHYIEGSSFFYTLYRILPNDTDLTVFRPTNIPSLNFAFGNHLEAYHTRLDTADNLSADSVQLDGTYALYLTQHFGQLDLATLQPRTGDNVFFNLLGKRLIAYPENWTTIGEILITLLLFTALFVAFRRRELRGRKFLICLLAVIASALALPATLAAVWWIISSRLPLKLLIGDTLSNTLLLIGLLLLGAAVADTLFRRYSSAFTRVELFLAALAFTGALSWALVILLPAGSYVLQIPLILLVLGFTLAQIFNKTNTAWLAVAGVPGWVCTIFLFAPLLYLVYIFMTLNYVVVVSAGILLAIFTLFSIPLLSTTAAPGRPWFAVSGVLAVAGLCCVTVGALKSHYSEESPKPDNLLYSLDSDHHSAAWISGDGVPDNWVARVIPANSRRRQPMPDYLVNSPFPVWTVPAPALELAPPLIVVSDAKSGDTHNVVLTLRSQRDARVMHATLGPDVTVLSARIAGRDVPLRADSQQASHMWSMTLYGWGQQAIKIEMKIKSSSNPTLWIADESAGLPLSSAPRPADLIAWYGSDVTLVNRKLTLGENLSAEKVH
jgi:anti-sigma factor RsiW